MATTSLPVERETRVPARTARRRPSGATLMLLPPLALLVIFLVLPLILVLVYSFYTLNPVSGLMQQDFSIQNYKDIVNQTLYLRIFWRTFEISIVATAVALLLAYPMGYAIGAVAPPRLHGLLLLLVIIPFWTSYIVRTYAWIGILQSHGFLDSLLGWIPGLSVQLLYTRAAVIIGFVHVYLPIMILPIFASARNLDRRLIEAAQDLGASPLRTFWRVTFPLTLPGVVAGIVLFFIPTFGSFVTPQLLGGTGDLMVGNVIADQFGEAFNWPFGAALSIVVTLVVIIGMAIFFKFADVDAIYG